MEISKETILDIESSINILTQQKEKLVFDKKEFELQSSILNNQIRSGGRIQDTKYKKICDEQNKIKKDVLKIERAINEIAIQIRNKSILKEKLKIEFDKKQKIDVKQKLIELRDHYINFASDKSRVSSMRAMAAEFAEKIESLNKSL